MSRNSLFAILLRSPWWASAAIGAALALVAAALLPEAYKVVGAFSAFPFVVIAALAARRQWQTPGAARIQQTVEAASAMAWPQFSDLLEQAFRRDGFAVQRGAGNPVDFEIERQGRRTLVCARRWKGARTGLEPLRALQAAIDRSEASDAIYVGLGALSDNARPFAAQHAITVWQSAELARALRGLPLKAPVPRRAA
jgi:restriction system protein